MYILTGFTLDNTHSSEMGVIACRVNGESLIKFHFGIKRSIVEEKISSNKLIHFDMDKQPLEFSITLTLTEKLKFDYDKRYELVQWLFQDNEQYRQLIFDDNNFICYYVIAIDESDRYDTSLEQGYIDIKFRCDSPHAWFLPINVEYDFADIIKPTRTLGLNSTNALTVGRNSIAPNPLQLYNPTSLNTYSANTLVTVGTTPTTIVKDDYNDGTVIITQNGTTTFKYAYGQEIIQAPHSFVLENKSNIEKYVYPEIEIEFEDNTDITITNVSDNGNQLKLSNMSKDDTVYIDNDSGKVKSANGYSVLSKCNRNWLRLGYGKNKITVNDSFKGKVRARVHTPVAL